MASPLGHSLIGFIIARAQCATPEVHNSFIWFAFAILAANAPDLDFLPGLLLDQPFRFHRGLTHSLMAACVFSGIVYLLARRMTPRAGALATLGFSCYASHLALDLPGVPLFWPFSSAHPAIALPAIGEAIGWERAGGTANFLDVLFSRAFFQTMAVEALVVLLSLVALRMLVKFRSTILAEGKARLPSRSGIPALRHCSADTAAAKRVNHGRHQNVNL